ncbi:MAG: carboxypeptidase regulatory-like domain-containing protein, partial [Acidobacteriota bacterium]
MARRVLALGLLSFAALAGDGAAASAPPTLVRTASSFGVSRPLGELAALQKSIVRPGPAEWERENRILPRTRLGRPGASADAALQGGPRAPAAMPSATTFEGLSSSNNLAIFGSRPIPPDTVGDVGPNHYVQMVNTLIRVFAKDGTPLTPFFAISDLFATVGPPCAGTNDGDPIVLYDPLADRWLLSQLCGETTAARDHELIAISTTGDPTGTYFVYDFLMPNDKFLDYPHFGVWPDAYYMTENQFIGNTFAGGGAFAFDRTKMVAGDPTASYVYFDEALVAPGVEGQLPSDFDGAVVPPAGTPNLFIDFKADEFGDPADALRIFEFHADFDNPGSSTFTARPDVPLAAFDPRDTATRTAVAQPPPASSADFLDSLAGQMMHRVAYRTLSGGAQSFVLNFVVNVSGQNPTGDASKYQAGIRWVELRRNGATGAVTVNNQGTYAPGSGDGANGRDLWMGSVAQDNQGNIALGFSASSLTLFPSILYAGRLAGDPAGQLSQGEATLQAGGGSQTSPQSRWGDYSAMTVDPADECTFWYTNEYYATSSSAGWQTRIGHFKFSGCTAAGKGVIQGTVTDCDSAGPLPDAILTTPDGYLRSSDGAGGYSFTVAPGTYTITVRRPGYADSTQMVTVSSGGNVTQDFCLTAIPVLAPAAAALQQEDCPPGNGAIDPGETVTVNLCVANTGAAGTANLVGTLQASGGVTSPGAPQDFGAVAAAGGLVCRPFTFQASGSCGTTLVATLALEDGATSLGTVVFDLPLGAPVVPFDESFDAVTAPALPAGWTASNAAGSAPLWRTVTSNPDTLPNSAFVDDPASVADKRLTSPAFLVQTAGARVTFRHRFDLDEGFDGGVLEVSSPNINGGAFTDVTNATVGGSFLEGGYSTTLATGFGNPIGGRSAWTGTTFAEITTVVDLGSNVAGHTIQLRWRMATDSSFGGGGWWIDSISVADGLACCALPAFVGEPMSVDGHSATGTSSDVDGVLEPGESVLVSPAWRKTGGGSTALTGSASALGGPAGATYTIGDAAADYGTVGGATSDCFSATGDCYRMTISNPASRPAT